MGPVAELLLQRCFHLIFDDEVTRTVLSVMKSVLLPDRFDDSIRDVGILRKCGFEMGGLFIGCLHS